MNTHIVVIAASFLLIPFQIASAQSSIEDDWYMPDARDDVVAGDSLGVPSALVGSADLLGIAVNVRDGNVSFRIETAATATEAPAANSVDYTLDFAIAGLPYRLTVERLRYADTNYGTPGFRASFLVYDAATDAYRPLLQPPVVPGIPPSSFVALVSLLELRGPDGLPLVSGQALEGARLRSSWSFSEQSLAPTPAGGGPTGLAAPTWVDSLPDSGTIDIPVALPSSDAMVRLNPSTLFKVSNGEPRLMFFATSVTNTDSQDLEIEVEVKNAPSWWQLRVSSPKLTIAAGETAPMFFVVQTLGRHIHGTFDEVNFTLTDQLGRESPGILRIDYHDIPQPSGHHPRVYVHSLGAYTLDPLIPTASANSPVIGYMNTLLEDERDTRQGLANSLSGGAASWNVPLSPELQMGLLVNPQGSSQIALCMRLVGPPMPQTAEVWGAISIKTDAEPMVLLESETGAMELSNQDNCIELPMNQVGPHSIDPKPGQNLMLSGFARLDDSGIGLGTTRVHLMPGTWADLPLHEYVEPLPQGEGQTLSWLDLSEPRPVPIGSSSLSLAIASRESKPARLLLDVISPLDWRIELSTAAVEVPAGGQATVGLKVHAPDTAILGRPVQAILLATDERGQAVLGSLVLVPSADLQAETAPEVKAPSIAPPIIILALLATVFALRRRI